MYSWLAKYWRLAFKQSFDLMYKTGKTGNPFLSIKYKIFIT